MIESYSFGKMKIDGQIYKSDLAILPGRVNSSWWRKEGHNLHPEDLKEFLAESPEVLIIGTGYFGLMKISDETKAFIEGKNIEFEADKTGRAVEYFNKISKTRKTIGVFHLTC